MRSLLTLVFLLLLQHATRSQVPDRSALEVSLLEIKNMDLPNDLTSSRTLVMYVGSGSWKEKCSSYHDTFVKIGIDPVLYVHHKDMFANDAVRAAFQRLYATRGIKNTIIIRDELNFSIMVVRNKGNGGFDHEKGSWRASGADFEEVAITLALSLRSANLPRTNFLMLTAPEYLEDINLFRGKKYDNYPGAIRRQKVGLALFKKFPSLELGERGKGLIEAYNQEIDKSNEDLREAFAGFEWDWQEIDYSSNETTLKEGVQYVVQVIGASGNSIKRLLNYPKGKNETHFISVTPAALEGEARLKRIASDNFMHKIYIHQVRADDVFVGEEWDADLTWTQAFNNFFFTMYRQFE